MTHIHWSVFFLVMLLSLIVGFAVGRAFRRSSDYDQGWSDAEQSGRLVFPTLKPGRRWRKTTEEGGLHP